MSSASSQSNAQRKPGTAPPTAPMKAPVATSATPQAKPNPTGDNTDEEFDDEDHPFYRRPRFYAYILAGMLVVIIILLAVAFFINRKCGGEAVPLVAALDPSTHKSAPFTIITSSGTLMLQNNANGSLSFVQARSVLAPTAWQQFFINSNNQLISQADGNALTMGATAATFTTKQTGDSIPASQIWMLKPTADCSPNSYALFNQSQCIHIAATAGIRAANDAYGATPVDIVMLSAYGNYIAAHGGFTSTTTTTTTATSTTTTTGTSSMSPVSIRIQTPMGLLALTLSSDSLSWQPLASDVDPITQRFLVYASESAFGMITTTDGSKVLAVSSPVQEGGPIVFVPKSAGDASDMQLWRMVRDAQNHMQLTCKAMGGGNSTIYLAPMMDDATRVVPAATMNASYSYPVHTV